METFLQHAAETILPTLGVGGILALFMFHFYRSDCRRWLDRDKELIDRFELLASDFKAVVQENTKVITILSERIK